MNACEIKVGMQVTMAGFAGTVVRVCEWSRAVVDGVEGVMVEVRLPGGIGCYSNRDLVNAEDGPGEEDGPWADGWAERYDDGTHCESCGCANGFHHNKCARAAT
jgi:hypothetical protein